jgi:hypothetical protein
MSDDQLPAATTVASARSSLFESDSDAALMLDEKSLHGGPGADRDPSASRGGGHQGAQQRAGIDLTVIREERGRDDRRPKLRLDLARRPRAEKRGPQAARLLPGHLGGDGRVLRLVQRDA